MLKDDRPSGNVRSFVYSVRTRVPSILASKTPAKPQPHPAARGSSVEETPHKHTVLIVEDDRDLREMLDLLLSTSGYETMTAPNGAVALEQMRERKPCLVLLDLMMPVMNGWDFRQYQRADPDLSAIPVVCISAVAQPAEVAQQLGARCIRKPFQFDVLLDEVRETCSAAHS
jgi:CheY-like chemotaxis protein